MEFSDKVVLVTGAARGIGAEAARQLAAEGAQLVIADIDGEGAARLARQLDEGGAQPIGVRCDITDPAEIEHVKEQVMARFGRVDLLINNAAPQQFGPGNIDQPDYERYRQSFEVNVFGALRMAEAFLPRCTRTGPFG